MPSAGDAEGECDRSSRHLSDLLEHLVRQKAGGRLSICDLRAELQDRATLALMIVFNIINILPSPPGTSLVLGLPILYLSLAMVLDRQPWFPRFIAEREMSGGQFASLVTRAIPVMRRLEGFTRPRFINLSQGLAFRFSGLMFLFLSVILILPVPLGNILPAASMIALALAMAMRDGVGIVLGWLLSLVSIILMSGLVVATFALLMRVFSGLSN